MQEFEESSQPRVGCRWKRVWLCKQNQICDGGAGSQSDSAAAQLDRVGSVWWQQSVAIVSCCSLILSPSYAASMPYQARISAQCSLQTPACPSFHPVEWKEESMPDFWLHSSNAANIGLP